MQALNHVAFGTLIAITVKQPAAIVPITVISHFVLDMLPHYGEDPRAPRGSNLYHYRILIDGLASLPFLGVMTSFFSAHAGIIVLGAFFALLPDFFWPLALYIKKTNPLWKFLVFHKKIQKFESPTGIYVEVVWLIATTTLILTVN